MGEEPNEPDLTVLVTGFGEFQGIKVNPAFEIVSLLSTSFSHQGLTIRLIALPTPLKAAYHSLLATVPPLIDQYDPDIVIHVGLATDRNYFAIEKGAEKDGYQQYPDEARKVFTKAEMKKTWGKSPENLETTLDCENVAARWKNSVGKLADVRAVDDVGNYVCGFVYYLTLEHFWKRGDGDKKVVFFHVPWLKGEKELDRGKKVTMDLVRAVAEVCRK